MAGVWVQAEEGAEAQAFAALLAGSGALRPGHTTLQGGAHTGGWIEKGEIIRDPLRLDEVARLQAAQLGRVWPEATLLVGLPECGAVLAAFVARHLGLPVAFVHSSGVPGWHRMHVPERAQRIVIVDDLIGTGRGVRAAAAFLCREGHAVLGVSAWVSRAEPGDLRVLTLMPRPYPTWPAGCCPHCSAGYPVRHVGVRE